ncbi:N-acetylmuramoyl-L-alanine amidase [Geovibrio ferrireducens]|uniref:N-acetylmuramoyl-L-alanine amidase n=1 Tax=Geovibrio ferrireducens TaxID=46201 RepID=UPI00224610B4|nr:N-acetylmuramoyl-L-alanine amidase [Geovibrio ferrireducens]
MKKKNLLLILILLASFASAFAEGLIDKYNSAKNDLAYIEKSSKVTRKSYENVADRFFQIYSVQPSGALADDALHYTAQTYYRSYKRFNSRDDLLKTIRNLNLLAVNYNTRLASLAYIQLADIYIASKDYPSARFTLNKMLIKFPKSEDTPAAKNKLEQINELIAAAERKDRTVVPPAAPPVLASLPEENLPPAVPELKSNPASAAGTVSQPAVKSTDSFYTDQAASDQKAGENYYGVKAGGTSDKVVKSIRHFAASDYTRVVIDLNKPTEFMKHWLRENPEFNKPPRLFIDLQTDSIDASIPKEIDIKDGLLRSVRWAPNRPGVTRIVLDSDNVKDFTVFAMSNPDRIVIDVSNQGIDNKQPETLRTAERNITNDRDLSKTTLASVFGLKVRRIVIDAGHGGKDPGASYYGLKEKDIVLDIALELERLFKQNTDLEVHLTRRTDVFIPLEERTAIANRLKADIFVSVHVNASRNKNSSGLETFVLNVTKDQSALEVAAAENMATEKSMSDLQGILKDIMLNSKLEESLLLAAKAQESLTQSVYGTANHKNNRGVKQAPFYVLVGAKMPSILVEAGFISNREEAEMLKSSAHRKKIAYGIFQGLQNYIELHK